MAVPRSREDGGVGTTIALAQRKLPTTELDVIMWQKLELLAKKNLRDDMATFAYAASKIYIALGPVTPACTA